MQTTPARICFDYDISRREAISRRHLTQRRQSTLLVLMRIIENELAAA